jgi:hypothetical protein
MPIKLDGPEGYVNAGSILKRSRVEQSPTGYG